MAIRISQVSALDSPRKCFQLRCAFRKHSCVSVSARSTSRSDASKNRENLRPVTRDDPGKLLRSNLLRRFHGHRLHCYAGCHHLGRRLSAAQVYSPPIHFRAITAMVQAPERG